MDGQIICVFKVEALQSADELEAILRVFLINIGEGNQLWDIAREREVLLKWQNPELHRLWRSGDRANFIRHATDNTVTSKLERPTERHAALWWGYSETFEKSVGDLWVTRQGDRLWWTETIEGNTAVHPRPSHVPERIAGDVLHLEKPTKGWSCRDKSGRVLYWDGLHPKAREFLFTQATMSERSNVEYSAYTIALINGEPLDRWHDQPDFQEKLESTTSRLGAGGLVKTYSNVDVMYAAIRMARTILETVGRANGQREERVVKAKSCELSPSQLEELLQSKILEQGGCCALTGLPLGLGTDKSPMMASADRIDSNGNYTPQNIQVVCSFVNFWKGATPDEEMRRLLAVLREHWSADDVPD